MKTPDFGVIAGEFINLYSEENPILSIGDVAFFLFTNTTDYHRPLIGKGVVMFDEITDGFNKLYHMEMIEIIESPQVYNEFILNKMFKFSPKTNLKFQYRFEKINEFFDFKSNYFKIEAFFIRNSLEKIIDLRNSYIQIIKKDILKQLSDIESI